MSNGSHSDIIIIGGGLTGLTAAIALADTGFSVTVVDKAAIGDLTDVAFDGRSSAIAHASLNLLARIGVIDHLNGQMEPIKEIRVSDGPSLMHLHFDYMALGDSPLGAMIENRHMRQALFARMADLPNLTYLEQSDVSRLEADSSGVTVHLAGGKSLTGKLLVGADGRASMVRRWLDIPLMTFGYKQMGIVCTICHEKPHNGIAHQFFMPGGPLAILPLPDNKCSIVWSEERARAEQIAALDDDAYMEALRPVFGDFLGDIHLTGARFTYPLNLTLANEFVAPRIALVGDAAHGVHPIAGQGLNLGMRDVGAWPKC